MVERRRADLETTPTSHAMWRARRRHPSGLDAAPLPDEAEALFLRAVALWQARRDLRVIPAGLLDDAHRFAYQHAKSRSGNQCH